MRWKSIYLDRLTDSIHAPRQNNEGSRKGGHVGNLNSKVSAHERCRREQITHRGRHHARVVVLIGAQPLTTLEMK
jgi:hypothetical protein